MSTLHSALGYLTLLAIAWLTGRRTRAIPWQTLSVATLLQLLLTGLLLQPAVRTPIFVLIGRLTVLLEKTALKANESLLFGGINSESFTREHGPVLALKIAAILIFVASLSRMLYHYRILPWIIARLSRAMQLLLDISWESRLQPIYLAIPLSSIKVRTDSGETLHADDPEGVRTANMEGNVSAATLQVPLESISRKATIVRSLSGKIDAVIPGHTGQFLFEDLSQKNQRQLQAGVEVILKNVKVTGSNCQVDFTVFYREAANAFESHRGWIRNNPAWLVDQQGNRLKPEQRRTTGQGDRKLDFQFHFPVEKSLESYRFVYQTPVLLLRQSIPFELREIPLP